MFVYQIQVKTAVEYKDGHPRRTTQAILLEGQCSAFDSRQFWAGQWATSPQKILSLSFFLLHEALDVLCRILKAGKDIAAEDKRKILHDQSDPCWNIWIWRIMKPKSLLLMALGLPGQECLGHLALSQYMFASGCWCFDCFWYMVPAGLGVQDSEVNFSRTAEACCHVMKTQLERESMQASSVLVAWIRVQKCRSIRSSNLQDMIGCCGLIATPSSWIQAQILQKCSYSSFYRMLHVGFSLGAGERWSIICRISLVLVTQRKGWSRLWHRREEKDRKANEFLKLNDSQKKRVGFLYMSCIGS